MKQKLNEIKKLKEKASEKKLGYCGPCFLDYSPDAGNRAYEIFKLQLEKGYPKDQINIFIDGMDCGMDLYNFNHVMYDAAEQVMLETGKIPDIGFQDG